MLKQSERAATPFLISKQPYFPPPSFFCAFSFLVSRISSEPLALATCEPRRFITLNLFLGTQRSHHPPSRPYLFSRSFRQRLPFLARSPRCSFRAVLRSYSRCSHLITAPLSTLPLHGSHFSFHPLHPFHIIFLANRLIHSPQRRYLQRAVHRETRVIDNKLYKAIICNLNKSSSYKRNSR